ncbi:MAG: N-acetylmuramoyl-L-alanine amidase AmiC [Alphaproteobacteria bacterium MarineAlpha12_Bin1]|jgi:N-acetylmuramoyl-L-alanine amidase|nr:MAG: N-acetylmuramoyl-L-alanine amidase AmiC [Alphaproteobacteria bacterium MarineAlpha12_Bin1]|tara:strand:- start:2985 stop:4238 length:1254 start_codon:yes stop_codon:yes gene_type:complete
MSYLFLKKRFSLVGSVSVLITNIIVLIAISFLGPLSPTAIAETTKVEDIRIGVRGDLTRLVIDLNKKVSPNIFGLENPYRIVIDLPDVDFFIPPNRKTISGGLIESLRYGFFTPGNGRLVIDLRSPIKIKNNFVIPPQKTKKWRLVFDLIPTTRVDFIETMGPSQRHKKIEYPQTKKFSNKIKNILPVVAIDAGHGGVDPGAIGVSGVTEKNLVLSYVKELDRQLRATNRIKTVLIRNDDTFVSLRNRIAKARDMNADLFLSIHANAHKDAKVRGFSAYTLSEKASDVEAQQLANKENKSDVIGGLNLGPYSNEVQNILIDFAQAKTNELSIIFARDILLKEASKSILLLKRPWRSAGFTVLKAPDVPSILIELGYITNKEEKNLLNNPAYKKKLCDVMKRAILKYLDLHSSKIKTP